VWTSRHFSHHAIIVRQYQNAQLVNVFRRQSRNKSRVSSRQSINAAREAQPMAEELLQDAARFATEGFHKKSQGRESTPGANQEKH
jgi:hypothetical protein